MPPVPDLLDPADSRPAVAGPLRHWLALQKCLALRPAEAAELLRRTGDPRAALLASRAGSEPPAAELDAAVAALRRLSAVALPFLSPAYPPRLANLPDPAPLLVVRGEVGALAAPSVAIVGSRAATAYGRAAARKLAGDLARAGLVVVSGLALGIDAVAHGAALDAGGRTVAVQACGPEMVYPPVHRGLADRIARQGAVVSEFPPGIRPLRHHFPLRNRLISGLALALIVVEARERSGSLITAQHAAEQGVDVFAVPGPISAPTSAGTNQLLRHGAGVALEAEDILGALRLSGVWREPRVGRATASPRADEAPERRRILDALLQEPATRDELGRRLERTPEQLACELLELEMEGRVAEDRDGRLRVVAW
jgi:DNA processing protein